MSLGVRLRRLESPSHWAIRRLRVPSGSADTAWAPDEPPQQLSAGCGPRWGGRDAQRVLTRFAAALVLTERSRSVA